MNRKEREWVINSLSFIARYVSQKKLACLGFSVGEGLYQSIKAFCASGVGIYETPNANYPGRKRRRMCKEIENQWVDHSQMVSRANCKGENLRIVLGGKAKVARSIVADLNCSIATAYNYCPAVVVATRKHSDLCLFCEALRKLRIECIHLANKLGAGLAEFGEFSGQGKVREPGKQAVAFLKSLPPDDNNKVTEILSGVDILSWHENLGQNLADAMRSDCGKKLVICFDYSSAVKLTGYRGSADEFFRPKILSLFGVMFVLPKPNGEFSREYVDIFSFDSSHTSNDGVASLRRALRLAAARKIIPETTGESVFYSDKAKHFCSGEMAFGVLLGITGNIQDVTYTYHACYHGKTPLDAHFSQVKRAVKLVAVTEWPSAKKEVEKLVLESVSTIPKTAATFLGQSDFEGYNRQKLLIREISHVQRIRVKKFGPPEGDVLTVEDTAIPIRIKGLGNNKSEQDSETSGDDVAGWRGRSIVELCKKLQKQKKKLAGYQKNVKFSPTSLLAKTEGQGKCPRTAKRQQIRRAKAQGSLYPSKTSVPGQYAPLDQGKVRKTWKLETDHWAKNGTSALRPGVLRRPGNLRGPSYLQFKPQKDGER